jgi:hypothetical protein
VPFLVNLCFLVLIADSDNILFFVIKSGFAPFALIFLTSQISHVRHHALSRQSAGAAMVAKDLRCSSVVRGLVTRP